MANKNEQNEIVEALCNLFGVNANNVKVNNYENVTEEDANSKTQKVSFSASVNTDDKNANDNKKFEELKKAGLDLRNSIENLKANIENKIKENNLDKKVEEISDFAQSKGLSFAQGVANLLGELSEAVQNEVDKRDPNIQKTEVDETEECEEEETGMECPCEDCEECEECPCDEEYDDSDPCEDDGEDVPYTASEIRAKLKEMMSANSKEEFLDLVHEMTSAFVDFCIENEQYHPVSEDLDGDEGGIYCLMNKSQFDYLLSEAQSVSNFDYKNSDIDIEEIKSVMMEAVECSAEEHEFDESNVEFLVHNPIGEPTKKKDYDVIKFILWF